MLTVGLSITALLPRRQFTSGRPTTLHKHKYFWLCSEFQITIDSCCEELADAEERAEHCVYNRIEANQMAALRLMKLTLGFLRQ